MNILLQTTVSDGLFNGLMDKVGSPDINKDVLVTTAVMVGVALGLATVFALIQIAIELGKRFTGSTSAGFSFLPKYAVMALCLVLYIPLMKIVDAGMSIPVQVMKSAGVKSATDLKNARAALQKPQIDDSMDATERATENLRASSNATASFFSYFNPANFGTMFAMTLIQLCADIIDVVMFLIRQYLINVLFVCGPLALAFSFIKNLEGSFVGFLKYYMVIHLWATIAYVLDNIYTEITIQSLQGSQQWFNSGAPSYDTVVYQLGFIILHLMIPKLADILISGSQGGAFFSAATAVVTKGIGMATAAMSSGASVAAAKVGGAAASAAGKKITE